MRDQFEHDVINARQSGGRTVREAGQFPAVAPGQMPPGHLDLLFDQVKVIEQPFGGGSDAPALVHGEGRAIEGSQDLLVLIQPGEQPVGAAPGDDLVIRRERLGMARQLFDAEQLRPQRRLARARRGQTAGWPAKFQSAATWLAFGYDSSLTSERAVRCPGPAFVAPLTNLFSGENQSGYPAWIRTMNNASKGRCVTSQPESCWHFVASSGLVRNQQTLTRAGLRRLSRVTVCKRRRRPARSSLHRARCERGE